MKSSSGYSGRFALTGVAAAALCLTVSSAWGLGLGRLVVQSAIGEGLRAEIEVTSLSAEEASNLKIRVAPPESYRAAGVDYNSVLPATQAVLQRRADGRSVLRLSSDRPVQEPFVDVILELSWNTGRLVREYTLLFDPPVTRSAATPSSPAAATAPVIAAAPAVPAERPVPAEPRVAPARPAPAAQSAAEPRLPARVAKGPAAVAATPAAPDAGAGEYRVKPGDTLSRIAGRTLRPGVSLDQMLVSLYRGNSQAFIGNNMNLLKSGVVLAVPSAEAAKAATVEEARQVIQAQSADFGAYRQRLAAGVPGARIESSARQSSGKVQAAVEDRKQAAATAPDKLTLSKGTAGAKASAAEEQLSKERETKDAAARTAELKKNVEDLKKMAAAAATPASKPPAVAAAAPAAPAPAAAPAAAPAQAPAPVAVTPPVVVAQTPPPAPAQVPASMPVVVAAAPAVPAAPVVASTPAAKPAASTPPRSTATPSAAEEPGLISSLLDDNPMALTGGGLALALLAGFGVYRYAQRKKKDSGETSFLESRLQPDSFFGASGGQRIDTREAGGASSSMSYSLSQLDAIGDVDPVAEADVYLAYGRDLQAEEILKEAMRSSPDRLAVRTKLLEVYAKRRDTKGFELLATQLFALTRGEGEDWAKAQELGVQIDPDNVLYRPGGEPALAERQGGGFVEPLGASTMPQSVLPSPSQFEAFSSAVAANAAASSPSMDLDLDLDLAEPAPMIERPLPEITRPIASSGSLLPPHHSGPSSKSMDFDLSGISLDLDAPDTVAPHAAPPPDAGSVDLLDAAGDGSDPFELKLALAEEFRQIGDLDGARDLLRQVIAKSSGALKFKAQSMLDTLG